MEMLIEVRGHDGCSINDSAATNHDAVETYRSRIQESARLRQESANAYIAVCKATGPDRVVAVNHLFDCIRAQKDHADNLARELALTQVAK